MFKGYFISIEGIDGSGKSTLITKLSQALQEAKKNVLITKEPGGSVLGKKLRNILQKQTEPLSEKSEFLLFAADRAQHFERIIIPALEKGLVVVTDRCIDSSLAYQGYGHRVDLDMIKNMNQWVIKNFFPNLTFYLRIDVETASKRLAETREELTTFEQEKFDFWERVIKGYEVIFENRKNVCTLDATENPETIFTNAWNYLSEDIGLQITSTEHV
jgi:dTMP kinase